MPCAVRQVPRCIAVQRQCLYRFGIVAARRLYKRDGIAVETLVWMRRPQRQGVTASSALQNAKNAEVPEGHRTAATVNGHAALLAAAASGSGSTQAATSTSGSRDEAVVNEIIAPLDEGSRGGADAAFPAAERGHKAQAASLTDDTVQDASTPDDQRSPEQPAEEQPADNTASPAKQVFNEPASSAVRSSPTLPCLGFHPLQVYIAWSRWLPRWSCSLPVLAERTVYFM